jgi:hypothetical protein
MKWRRGVRRRGGGRWWWWRMHELQAARSGVPAPTERRGAVRACAASEHLRAGGKRPSSTQRQRGSGRRLTAECQGKAGKGADLCSQVDGMRRGRLCKQHAARVSSLQGLPLRTDVACDVYIIASIPWYHGSQYSVQSNGGRQCWSHIPRCQMDGVSGIVTVDYRPALS